MACCRFSLLARQFSTGSVGNQLIKPPIQVFGIGGRYAHALYSAASKEKNLDVINQEIQSFQSILKKSASLSDFIANPIVKRQDKISVLQEFGKTQKMSPITVNFMSLLAENNRLKKLREVFNAWGQIISSHRGEVICNITTAKTIDTNQQKEVTSALQGFLKKGEVLKMNMLVDPSILGGMVVEIGDKYVDMSTAAQVKTMTNLIKESV